MASDAFVTIGQRETAYLTGPLNSNELAVDGRSPPIEFSYTVPTGFAFYTDRIVFVVIASGVLQAHRFGNVNELPIGVDFDMIFNGVTIDLLDGIDLTKNGDFAKLSGSDIEMIGNNRGLVADMTWGKPLRLPPGSIIRARVNDNLSRLTSFTIALKGEMMDIVQE